MNLPNKLTCGRLLLTGLFVLTMSLPNIPGQVTIGLLLFLIASITDFLDGYLARKHALVTDFGKLMDPLADKILTSAVFVVLTATGAIPAWVTILIITREFLVTGLRLIASAQGAVLAADKLGKWKTTFQIATAIYFLLMMGSDELLLAPMTAIFAPIETPMGVGLIAATLLLTTVSGLSYMVKNRALISDC